MKLYFCLLIRNVIVIDGDKVLKRRPTDMKLAKIELEYCTTESTCCVDAAKCLKMI